MEKYEEQPPRTCWDSLSKQLDNLRPEQTTVPQTETASAVGKTVRTGIRKFPGHSAFSVTGSIAAVGAVTTMAVFLLRPSTPEKLSIQMPDTPVSVITGDTLTAHSEEDTSAKSQTVKEQSFTNTTFSEGIPYHLLTEDTEPTTGQDAVSAGEARPERHQTEEKKQTIAPIGNKMETPTTAEACTEPVSKKEPSREEEKLSQPGLRIPNVISPNGDHINDCFVIENLQYTERNQLTIYNRYGKVVYNRRNYDNSWNAENLPEGIYRYCLTFEYEGHEFIRQGSISVIR